MANIDQHFQAYSEWRKTLFDSVGDLKQWLRNQELADVQIEQKLDNVLSTLRDDKLYVAFVAEFSRGKSELINAIFFASFGQRVLPSSAGRTTMCPTELMYDKGSAPCVRLLPIETRAGGTTVSELKGFQEEWTTIPLDTSSPESVAKALQHIAEVKAVTKQEAQSLGMPVAEEETQSGMPLTADGKVEVPRWRHAIINFPHPLLEQGLVILDTPGLNALGTEPELTLSLLPSAHAVLFILAADAGVTKSDIQVWHDHIANQKGASNKGRFAVLNKIDGLWDELREWSEVEREIDRQVHETARHLGIPTTNVYPVSAQKALYAKIKGDTKILERSRIAKLEDALGQELIPSKREIVRDNLAGDMADIIKAMKLLIMQRLKGVYEHIEELGSLTGKNQDVINHMMDKVKVDKEHFEKSLMQFQATRSIFSKQTNVLYSHLNLKNLDKLIAETKKDMDTSLTTAGLRTCMQTFFTQSLATMDEVAKQSQEIKELMEAVYKKFQEEYGLSNVKPKSFSIGRYTRELKRLQEKHADFMKGMSLVFTEQKNVTNKFFDTVVAKVRAIFAMANRDVEGWLKTIMSPMEAQVREHQILLRRRLESIKRIHKATDTLEDRLAELEHIRQSMREQEASLATRVERINGILSANLDNEGTLANVG